MFRSLSPILLSERCRVLTRASTPGSRALTCFCAFRLLTSCRTRHVAHVSHMLFPSCLTCRVRHLARPPHGLFWLPSPRAEVSSSTRASRALRSLFLVSHVSNSTDRSRHGARATLVSLDTCDTCSLSRARVGPLTWLTCDTWACVTALVRSGGPAHVAHVRHLGRGSLTYFRCGKKPPPHILGTE